MSKRKRKGQRRTTKRARVIAEALREDGYEVSHAWVVSQVKELWPTALAAAGAGPGVYERAQLRLIELVTGRARPATPKGDR